MLIRRKRHLVYRLANGKTLSVSQTPSDRRTTLNVVGNLRRLMRGDG